MITILKNHVLTSQTTRTHEKPLLNEKTRCTNAARSRGVKPETLLWCYLEDSATSLIAHIQNTLSGVQVTHTACVVGV